MKATVGCVTSHHTPLPPRVKWLYYLGVEVPGRATTAQTGVTTMDHNTTLLTDQRREAIRLLTQDRYEDDDHNKTLIAAILPDRDPAEWEPLWEDLCERVQWLADLEDGASLDCADGPEDRDTVKDDVRSDITALIDHLAAVPAAPLRRAA